MTSIRSRIADFLLKEQKEKLERAGEIFLDAYSRGPSMLSPEELVSRLGELDSRYWDLIARQISNQSGGFSQTTETDRVRLVEWSRRMTDNDVITESIIGIWTDFGYGVNLDVVPRDKSAQDIWKDFWTRSENSRVLGQRYVQDLSNTVLRDGDILLVFFIDKLDGSVIIRVVQSTEIKGGVRGDGVFTTDEDTSIPVYYRREYASPDGTEHIVFYPDWQADEESLKKVGKAIKDEGEGELAEFIKPQTDVKAILVAHRIRKIRGWPLMSTGLPWSTAYRDFLQNRAAVARAAATYVDTLKVKGGQRAVDLVKASIQSTLATNSTNQERNPPPAAGSTWIGNDNIERSRLSMSTGAGDAATDSAALLAQAGLAGRVYPHWLGRGEAYRLATATSMETPVLRSFNRYQLFWSSVWSDVAHVVFGAANKYGTSSIEEMEVDVNTDALLTADVTQIVNLFESIGTLKDKGIVDPQKMDPAIKQLMRLALQALGVRNVNDILPDKLVPKEQPIPDALAPFAGKVNPPGAVTKPGEPVPPKQPTENPPIPKVGS